MLSIHRLAALLLPLVLACASCDSRGDGKPVPVTVATAAARDVRAPSIAPHFAPGQLEQHFHKHGAAMGFATEADYLRAAQDLVRGGPGVETLSRPGGDTLSYRTATGEFGVLSDRNVIRTYFKPDDGARYWQRQQQR